MKRNKMMILVLAILLALGLSSCGDSSGKGASDLTSVLNETAVLLVSETSNPTCGSVGGEWVVFGLAGWGGDTPDATWFDTYYSNLETTVKSCGGVLDARKYTEYSRVILALTAMGKNPMDVAGYNLLEPLADFDQTVFQGINGPAYALLAFDSGNYEIPAVKDGGTQASRDMYIDYILERELQNGGWSLSGGDAADADLTAMVLQALAKYQEREDVQAAVERGIQVLAELQNEDGSYTTYETDSSETISQVITALCELGISIDDERFVKDGKNLADKLLEYRAEDGGFKHTLDGDRDMLATEQAFYALVGLERVQQGETSLFCVKTEE